MGDGKLDDEVMKPGEMIPLEDDAGNELIGAIAEVEAHAVHVDFYYPLAGLHLHYEGVVVAILCQPRPRPEHLPSGQASSWSKKLS